MQSCLLPISSVGRQEITTIEGLSENGDHPVQKAWLEHDVSQCGYCQAGQIMTAAALLKKNPNPTDEEIENAMNGNICRCGTYMRIKKLSKLHHQCKSGNHDKDKNTIQSSFIYEGFCGCRWWYANRL